MSRNLTPQDLLEKALEELRLILAERVYIDRFTTEEGKRVIVLEVEYAPD